MSKAYQRADSLAEIIAKRTEKQKQSSAEKLTEIINKPKYGSLGFPYQFKQTGMKLEVIEEKDLRKDVPGQLEIKDNDDRKPKNI